MSDPEQVLDVLRDVLVEHMDDPVSLPDFRVQSVVFVGRSGRLLSADDIISARDRLRGLRLTMRSGDEYDLTLSRPRLGDD
jgi:hypothetical protein